MSHVYCVHVVSESVVSVVQNVKTLLSKVDLMVNEPHHLIKRLNYRL